MSMIDLVPTGTTREATVPVPRRYRLLKRAFDVVVCILALPLLLIAIGVIAVIIRLDSSGSPFFIQERIGKAGRPFRLYKFRTMRHDYDDRRDRDFMAAFVAGQAGEADAERDARYKPIKKQDITRVGRFLRKASLDELPQVINILKGEMSLVGPRPNVPWEVDAYHDWHRERLAVLPGITGLAQVHGRSNITFDEIAAYDVQYVRERSAALDLAILWRTFWIVLTSKGAG